MREVSQMITRRGGLAEVAIAPVTEAALGGALKIWGYMARTGVRATVVAPHPESSRDARTAQLLASPAARLTIIAPLDGGVAERDLVERDRLIVTDLRDPGLGLFIGKTLLADTSVSHGKLYGDGAWVGDTAVTIGGIDANTVITAALAGAEAPK